MITLGVTGGIASGKSSVAGIFADAGIPVFDADETVHRMYQHPSQQLRDAFPMAVTDGTIDRRRLAAILEEEADALSDLEAITHPFVVSGAEAFLKEAKAARQAIAVLDVPLLFESGLDALCDRTLVTLAPKAVREERITERSTMSRRLLQRLESRQMPDTEKAARADYVVDTAASRDEVGRTIRDIIAELIEIESTRQG